MRKILWLVVTLVFLLLTFQSVGQGLPVGESSRIVYTADLKAGNENPPTASAATGVAFINLMGNTLGYVVRSAGFGAEPNAVVAARIHAGAAGANGEVRFPLTVDASGNGNGTITLTVAERAEFLRRDFYVNLYTASLPNGVIRGQVQQNSAPALRYEGMMSGGAENPPTTSTATGRALVFFDPASNKLAYLVEAAGFGAAPDAVTQGHIRIGAAVDDGPVGVPLVLGADGNGAGIVIVDNTVKSQLLGSEIYVNLHTGTFPNGAIRGQAEIDPGYSFEYVYSRNAVSGTRSFHLSSGPSIVSTAALRSGAMVDLIARSLSLGDPDLKVSAPFDAKEFPGGPPRYTYTFKAVSIGTDTVFHVEPGWAVPVSGVQTRISGADFRNIYFQDFSVSIDDQSMNQVSAIPYLFGPVAVGSAQLGASADLGSQFLTAYNVCYRIISPGDYLVAVNFKQGKTIQFSLLPGDISPAQDTVLVIPVSVIDTRPGMPYMEAPAESGSPRGSWLEAQGRLRQLRPVEEPDDRPE